MARKIKYNAPSTVALDALFAQHRAQAKKVSKTPVAPTMDLSAMLGIQGGDKAAEMARAMDFFANPAARTGYGTPNLTESAEYPLVRLTFNYWTLISLFEGSWIARRIVETPAKDMVRAWPRLTSDIVPKELTKIDRLLRKTNTKNNILTAMTWARLFGGAGCLMVIEGQEHELDKPLDLDEIPIGGFKGLIPFDRWSGIYPGADICTDIRRPIDFNLPESYNVQGTGGQSFKVHASRILRFTGPTVPTPEREAYSMWGVSVIEPVYQELQKRDNVSWNIVNLTFRACILGMKMPDLASLMSGLGMPGNAGMQFEARMSQLNHLISNQSLVPLPADGSIESTQYSFSGLGEVMQQTCLDVSGAAEIPVTRLWGRTISGLGGSENEGDERIYEEKIATDQDAHMRPQLEKLYPVLCASELGEVPDDLDLNFPSIRVMDEKSKSELAKTTADTLTVYLNGGIMSPRTVAKEVKQSSDATGIGTNITDEDIAKMSDELSSEGELGEGLFGPGEGGLNPSSGPAKAIKEENHEGEEASGEEPEDEGDTTARPKPSSSTTGHQAPPRGGLKVVPKAKAADGDANDEGIDYLRKSLRAAGYKRVSVRPRNAADTNRVDVYCDAIGNREHVREDIESRGARFGVKVLTVNVSGTDYYPANDADGLGPAVYAHGLECVIETPKGGVRSGKGWEVTLPYSYGYIKGVQGADGDSVDVAIGTGPDNGWCYLIDQRHLDKPGFDEVKCFLQWPSATAALNAFKAGHHRWEEVLMDWTPMPIASFKEWLKNGDHTKPVGGVSK